MMLGSILPAVTVIETILKLQLAMFLEEDATVILYVIFLVIAVMMPQEIHHYVHLVS